MYFQIAFCGCELGVLFSVNVGVFVQIMKLWSSPKELLVNETNEKIFFWVLLKRKLYKMTINEKSTLAYCPILPCWPPRRLVWENENSWENDTNWTCGHIHVCGCTAQSKHRGPRRQKEDETEKMTIVKRVCFAHFSVTLYSKLPNWFANTNWTLCRVHLILE